MADPPDNWKGFFSKQITRIRSRTLWQWFIVALCQIYLSLKRLNDEDHHQELEKPRLADKETQQQILEKSILADPDEFDRLVSALPQELKLQIGGFLRLGPRIITLEGYSGAKIFTSQSKSGYVDPLLACKDFSAEIEKMYSLTFSNVFVSPTWPESIQTFNIAHRLITCLK